MKLKFAWTISFGLALGALSGCHRVVELHVTNAPPPALDAGWDLTESRDHSVSLAVPGGWRAGVDTAGDGLADLASKLGSSNTESQGGPDSAMSSDMQNMAQNFENANKEAESKALAALEKKGIVLNVINGSKPTPGEKRTRYYVLHTHASGAVSTEEATDIERNHYAFPPRPTTVTLPIGSALRFSADDSLNDGMTLHQISYVVIDGSDTYTLRFVTEEDGQSIQSIAEPVAKSLRIKPGH